ncbi:hypothetical protein C922_01023 [Plasmodium inui San Antonio 1]|uniref:Uncharacterized protein n=1 Tax=Plasmodium inui San Antonio 1 TaxID=1237626 RepID=W7AHY7_9APIC|nr:hypothetical protein C922_01023 [Plasmodium inui San Antonio 1]EUD68624.1 hypothetical protein C922_01023 [Plasmodium inui San Antonio 1]
MDLFTILFVLLILFFIFDYNFCAKGLVFSIGNKSLRILKGCSSLERVYRSPLYLLHPVLQQLFVHIFYIYVEKKKAYVNHLIWKKTKEKEKETRKKRKEKTKNSNTRKTKCKGTLNIPQFIGATAGQIKKWVRNKLWQFFFFIIEYTRVYENMCLKSNINTREVLNNNNFGVVIVDYYLPNCTVKKKKKSYESAKKDNYEIDLYDLVNIKQEKKIKLILIDQKWKAALNIGPINDAHVQFLYLQDTVLIQYFQFACIFKEEFLKESNESHVDGGDPPEGGAEEDHVEQDRTNGNHGRCPTQGQENAVKEEAAGKEEATVKRSHVQGEQFDACDEQSGHQNSLSGESSTIEESEEVHTGRKQNGLTIGSQKCTPEQKNKIDGDGSNENAVEDKIRTHMNKWKYKNVKGIIVIVPEIFYNYLNLEEVKNTVPLYYVLAKDVKIDSFTVIAKLLGYICVHVHININFGLSIPFIFSNKNANILNIANVESRNGVAIGGKPSGNVNQQYIHGCPHENSGMPPKQPVSSYKTSQDRDPPLRENFLHDEKKRVPDDDNQISSRLFEKVDNSNRNRSACDNLNLETTLKTCASVKTRKDGEVHAAGGTNTQFNAPLFSCPFSFYSDNYNDLNIAMAHFKSIFKNHNFVFLGFNDGTNILLNYFLEKIYKKKKNKTTGDNSKTPHFNLHNASAYKYSLLNYKVKGNADQKLDPLNNQSKEKEKNNSKIGQTNKSEEDEMINQPSYKNNIMNIFFKEKKKGESERTNGKNCFKEVKKWHIENLISDMRLRKDENSILHHNHVKDKQEGQHSAHSRNFMEENPNESYGVSYQVTNLPVIHIHGVDDKMDNHPVRCSHDDVVNNRPMGGHRMEGKGGEQYEAEQEYSDYTDCHHKGGDEKSDDRHTQEGNGDLNNDSSISAKNKKKKKHMGKIKNMKEKWKKKKIESFMNLSKLNFFNKGKDIWGKNNFVKESEFNAVPAMEGDNNLYSDMSKYNIKSARNKKDVNSDKEGNPHCNNRDSNQRAIPRLAHSAAGEGEDLVGHESTISLGTVRGERLHKQPGDSGVGQYDEGVGEDKENRNGDHNEVQNEEDDEDYIHSLNDREEGPKPIEAPPPDFDTSSMKKKKKMIKINVLDKFRNKETKVMTEGRQVEDPSGISQKFRYSFFRIKNKITRNFKNPECKKTQQEKNIMDRDQMMINSFIKNKNVLLPEEESNYSDTSTCDEYGKKGTKEICLLINFSYSNMFDIFNYPDDFKETKKKKFSLIHTIFYSVHIFWKSFSTLIKQRYFFSCTSELTKFFKASLFHRVRFEAPNRRGPQGEGSTSGGTLRFGVPTSREEAEEPVEGVNNGEDCQASLSRHSVADLSLNNGEIPLSGNPSDGDFSNYPIKPTNGDDNNLFSLSFVKTDAHPDPHPNHNYQNENRCNSSGKKGSFLNIGKSTRSSNSERLNNVRRSSGNESIPNDMNDGQLDICRTDLTNDEDSHRFSTTNKSRESATNQSFFRGSHLSWQNHHDGSHLVDHSGSAHVPIMSGNGEVSRSSNPRDCCFQRNFFEADISLLCGERERGAKFPNDCDFANGVSPNCGFPSGDFPNYDCLVPLEGLTNEGHSPNGAPLSKDQPRAAQKEVHKIYGGNSPREESFQSAMKVYFNAKAIYDKWKIYFEKNNFQGNAQEKFLFNLSFIYNVYNYLVWIYICTYFNEETYFSFCESHKFYQFTKEINFLNEKKEFKRNSSFVSTSDMSIIIPHFFYPKDYKLLKVFLYMLQDSANQFISKNIEHFQFPLVFIFCSDSRNFHFTHFDIIKISKNNNLIYLLYKRGNEGLFLSGFRPYIWIHKVLFDFVESLFLSTFDD